MSEKVVKKNYASARRRLVVHTILPAGLALLLFGSAMYGLVLPAFEEFLLSSRRNLTRELTQSVHSLLGQYQARVASGELTLEQAQERAKERIRAMRYGGDGKNYFWITDVDGYMVMHPYVSEVEGVPPRQQDAHTRDVIQDISDVVAERDSGFVQYSWQVRDDAGRMSRKLSHVRLFEPWGWIVGAGVYLDEVRAEVRALARGLHISLAAVLAVITAICAYLIYEGIQRESVRTHYQEELIRSERRYRTSLENMLNGYSLQELVYDESGRPVDYRILQTNPAFARLTGIEDAVGKTLGELMPNFKSSLIERAADIVKSGRPQEFEHHSEVLQKWFHILAYPAGADRFGITFIDITERKKIEEDLLLTQFAVDHSAESVYWVTSDARFCYVNEAACSRLGYSREELLEMTVADIDPAYSEDVWRQRFAYVREHKHHIVETSHRDRKGRVFPVEISVNYFDCQGREMLFAFARDISERKRAEEQLRQSEQRFRAISEESPAGVFLVDRQGVLQYVNARWHEVMAIGAVDNRDDAWPQRIHPEDREAVLETWNTTIERVGRDSHEFRVIHADGSIRWVFGQIAPMYEAGGKLRGFVGTVTDVTERKDAEDQVRRSEAKQRTLYEAVSTGVFLQRPDGSISHVNQMACEIFGMTAEEMIEGKADLSRWRLLLEDGTPVPLEEYPSQVTFRTGKPVRDVVRGVYIPEIEWLRWLLLNTEPIRDPRTGEITEVVITFADITRQRQAKEAYRQLSSRYEAILSAAPDIIAEIDPQKRYTWMNQAGFAFFGDDVIGQTVEAFLVGEQDMEGAAHALLSGEQDTLYLESLQRRKDGEPRLLAWWFRSLKDEHGTVTGALSTARDITDQKRAEEELRDKQRTLAALMSNLPGLAYRCAYDEHWTMQYISEGCLAITGYRPQDLIDNAVLSYEELIHPEDRQRVRREIGEYLERGEAFEMTYRIRGADNRIKWVLERGCGVWDEEDRLLRLEGFISDITRLKQFEREREQLLRTLETKNEELQSIVYIASHDLRSPLVNIQGFSGELNRSCTELTREIAASDVLQARPRLEALLNEDIPEALGFIRAGTDKMQALVNGLLHLSRVGTAALKFETLDINTMIEKIQYAMRYQIERTGAQVTCDPLPACRGDWAQVNQIFSNLLDNAMKYRDPRRSLRVHISARVLNGLIEYAVADNGVGIEKAYQEKIFEIFHQLNPNNGEGGEGLGLTIVKRILDRLDGQIRVTSEPGKGTTFCVLLPRAD